MNILKKLLELKNKYQENIRINLFGERDSYMYLGTTISFVLCLIVGCIGLGYLGYLFNFMDNQSKDLY